VLSGTMNENTDSISLHIHLLGDFLVRALLDAHQPERLGLLIGQMGQFTSHAFHQFLVSSQPLAAAV